jgi:hypothetical protein
MSDQAIDLVEAGGRPLGIGAACRARVGNMRRVLFLSFLIALTTAGSCNSELVFKSNFNLTAVNQPPSPTQAVGTASFDGPPLSVLVVGAPPNAAPPPKWLQINCATGITGKVCSFQGKLAQFKGNGTYVFSTELFMPQDNIGVATIQFEPFTQPVGSPSGFLHLDFMPDNRVRIDDDESTKFGTFPRNKPFLVQVTLNINDTSPKARIILSGDGASGQADRTVIPPLIQQARQFGAVRIWMGFPHRGAFLASDVTVTYKP